MKKYKGYLIFTKETLIKKSNAVKGGKNPSAIKVIDTEKNIIYDTMKIAAEENNIKYTSLSAMLNGYCKNKTNLKKI